MRVGEKEYYERRAREYDDWWGGFGRFSERDRPGWHEELSELEAVIRSLPAGRVLDAACGTGFLTRHLRGEVTALDESGAMLAVARERCPDATLVQGDALALPFEDLSFDLLFASHFYGHLRPGDRRRFLAEARRVAPGLVVVDSALRPAVEPEGIEERVLDDGSRYQVYKRYFTPEGLTAELGGGRLLLSGTWFVVVAA